MLFTQFDMLNIREILFFRIKAVGPVPVLELIISDDTLWSNGFGRTP